MKCKLNADYVCAVCGHRVRPPVPDFNPALIARECAVQPHAPDTECANRGLILRVEPCKPCQSGGSSPEIFACEIHGECTIRTISKRKPDGTRWAACATCEERQAVTDSPVP